MNVIRLGSLHECLARVSVALFCALGLSALLPHEAAAQVASSSTIYACVGKSSLQVRIVPEAEICKETETLVVWNTVGLKGDTGATGPQGPPGETGPQGPAGEDGADGVDGTDGKDGKDGLRSVAAATTVSNSVTFTNNTTCANLATAQITVPPGAPAPDDPDAPPVFDGFLIATAKVNVKMNHTSPVLDRGFAVFSLSPGPDCTGPDASNAAFRSYFSAVGATASSPNPPYETTVFVQGSFPLATGPGGSVTVYLNGMMISGATALSPDSMQEANVVLEYHPK
jgi:hypothetical protein